MEPVGLVIMDDALREKIRIIKIKIYAMLQERQQLLNNELEVATPSSYWADFCSYFDYMLGLPEDAFTKIRLHTYHLTGDNYQSYYFGVTSWLAQRWEEETEGIPDKYIIEEPKGGIGSRLKNGHYVSTDILMFQRVISTIYHHKSLFIPSDVQSKLVILEIGAGYGGLAHHLSNILVDATYIILDLPETIIFSAAYLSLLNPNKNIYIYDKANFNETLSENNLTLYDFILVPNYKLDELRHIRFDIVINVASFQEMQTVQVNQYLNFISNTCIGVFYSLNQDTKPQNHELNNLTEMFKVHFSLLPVKRNDEKITLKKRIKQKIKQKIKFIVIQIEILKRSPEPLIIDNQYLEYICTPLITNA